MADSTPSRVLSSAQTTARLSLGNPSPAVSTAEHLRFQLDHALARDAVHIPLDLRSLLDSLAARNLTAIAVRSNAPNRRTYLLRPDLGRTLHPDSFAALKASSTALSSRPEAERSEDAVERPAVSPAPSPRIAIVLADGLSSLALERHALPLLDSTLPLITSHLSLVTLATQARVAIGDPIGQLLHADITILLIGERPGLSSPDSLGCYITWNPCPGRTDAERNCISNIRGDEGLSYAEAAHRIAHYVAEATRLHITGIALKDPAPQKRLESSKLNTSWL